MSILIPVRCLTRFARLGKFLAMSTQMAPHGVTATPFLLSASAGLGLLLRVARI